MAVPYYLNKDNGRRYIIKSVENKNIKTVFRWR